MSIKVKVKKLREDAILPKYAHGPEEDAGMDLCAVELAVLLDGEPTLVPTGLSIQIPMGYEGQIRPRSGLALKHGIQVVNRPGTVDCSDRGPVGVILQWNGYRPNARVWRNLPGIPDKYEVVEIGSDRERELMSMQLPGLSLNYPHKPPVMETGAPAEKVYLVKPGDRIARIVFAEYAAAELEEVEEAEELEGSGRGTAGYGSTGK